MVAVKISRKHLRGYVNRFFPVTRWLPNYKIRDLRYDIIAGLTVGLTLVPQSMAYSQMASVSPQYGLYSSFIGQFIYVVLGTAKDAAIGPSAIVSMMTGGLNVANPLIKTGDNTYSCIMAFISGPILISIGVLKLGFFVNLFSIPVVSGFTSAAGFSIIASQLRPFFGLKDAPNDTPAVFVKQIQNVVDRKDEIKMYDVAFGLSSIGFLVFMQYMPDVVDLIIRKVNKRKQNDDNEKLTSSQATSMEYLRLFAASRNVIVFIFTTLAAYLLISADPTVESRLSVVRKIPPGLPPPRFPKMELVATKINNETNETYYETVATAADIFKDLTVSFIIIPLMIMLEQFAILKSLGRKNGYRIDPTNELICIGIVNFVQSFFQAFPVTAAVTRCALNDQCKVKTQLGSVISAIIVIIAIFALTETFYYISKAALAGIIILAAYNLIDFKITFHMWREYKRDVFILILTFLLCLFFDMAYGILIMILVNMITFLRPIVRMAIHVKQDVKTDEEKSRTIQIVKLSHGMKYPSADKFLDRVARVVTKADKHVVLDCQFFTGIDYTGLQALRGILLLAFRQNKHVIFANMSERLQEKVANIGLDHWQYVDSVADAVRQYDKEESSREVSVVVDNSDAAVAKQAARHRLASFTPSLGGRQLSRPRAATVGAHEQGSQFSSLADISAGHQDQQHPEDWKKAQDHILRQLTSGQAYFYQNIPISVGNVVEIHGRIQGDADDDDDDESDTDGEVSKVVVDDDDDDADRKNKNKQVQRPPGIMHSQSVIVDHHHISTITEGVPYYGDFVVSSARASLRHTGDNKKKGDYLSPPALVVFPRVHSAGDDNSTSVTVESNMAQQQRQQAGTKTPHDNRSFDHSQEEEISEMF